MSHAMNSAAALTRALELARADGWDTDEYEEPVVERDGKDWIVLFQGRSGRPGDHFMVVLNASSGAGRVVAGR